MDVATLDRALINHDFTLPLTPYQCTSCWT